YRARFSGGFSGPSFREILPYAISTSPIVVASQIGALVVFGVYARHTTRGALLSRLLPGTLVGTLVGAALIWQLHGLTGVSRAAFSADLLLFAFTTTGWRTGRALWRQRSMDSSQTPAMVDRAAERSTLGGTLAS